jgi:hypothetical protein
LLRGWYQVRALSQQLLEEGLKNSKPSTRKSVNDWLDEMVEAAAKASKGELM